MVCACMCLCMSVCVCVHASVCVRVLICFVISVYTAEKKRAGLERERMEKEEDEREEEEARDLIRRRKATLRPKKRGDRPVPLLHSYLSITCGNEWTSPSS